VTILYSFEWKDDRLIGKDLEENDGGLIEVLSQNLSGGGIKGNQKNSDRITGVPDESRNE
jgi:hypothetical protein